jgi:collagen type III alpha
VYIENTGTYEAESKGTTTFALTSKAATYSNPPRFGNPITYSYTGSDPTINVSGATHIKVVLKGAGGGYGHIGVAGDGGYTESEIELPSGTTEITLIVGQGGDSTVNTSKTYGGGGGSGDDGGATGGRGGGRTAIRIGSTEIVTAGGGGGSGYNVSNNPSKPGGGLIALGGSNPNGGGGTQTTGGSAGAGSQRTGGVGVQYEGGTGSITGSGYGGAGGGGGWYGGGGGGGQSSSHGAGGGGSGFAGRDGSTVLSGNEHGSTSTYADTTTRTMFIT